MCQQTYVYLLTGFLGSGKTTLLNRMTRALPAGLKTLVLMNEFGEIGVDGALVEKRDLTMIEINRGSIFCACVKSDFLKALVTIHQDVQPDLLIIESTGVANPQDLLRTLSLPLFAGRFAVKRRICVLDAANFTAVYDAFQSVADQIAASDLFVLNKTDLADPGEISRIEGIISGDAKNPVIFKTSGARIPFDWMEATLIGSGSQPGRGEATLGEIEAIDEAVRRAAMNDPEAQDKPSDAMSSSLMAWQGGHADELHQLIAEAPVGLARAKGFIQIDGKTRLLNWSINHFQLTEADPEAAPSGLRNKIVIIFRQEREKEIVAHLQAGGQLALLSVQRPMGIMPATQTL